MSGNHTREPHRGSAAMMDDRVNDGTAAEHVLETARGRGRSLYRWLPPDAPDRATALLPIVFLHGLGLATGLHASDLAAALTRRTRRAVLAPDLPGFGRSDEVALDEYQPATIASWIDHLLLDHGISRCAVVGHSWGAFLACHFAALRPARVAALALLDGGYFDPPARTWEDALSRALAVHDEQSFSTIDDYLATLRSHRPLSSAMTSAYLAAVSEDRGRVAMVQRPEVAAAITVASGAHPVNAAFPQLRRRHVPVLLAVPGSPETDPRGPLVQEFLDALPDATVRWLPGRSHFLPQDAGEELGRVITTWLRETRVDLPTSEATETDPA